MSATTAPIAGTATDRPSVFDDTALFGQPRGLGLLFLTEMWERFSYYGMRAILVLYLVNALGWSDARATNLYGTYTGLVYLTPLIGGYIADRFIGTRRSLVVGGIIIALGHFILAFQSMTTFYIGLAFVIIGTGFFKPNVSTMVGQIYRSGDSRRDAGFTVFYMGINVGATIAPLICGYLGQRVGWHYGFAAAGVGMVLGLITYVYARDKYLPGIGLKERAETQPFGHAKQEVKSAEGSGAILRAVIGAVVGLVLAYVLSGGNWYAMVAGPIVGGAIGLSVLGSQGEERKRVIALFIVVFFVIFFWMAYEQGGSSQNIFADRFTNLRLGSFDIPSSWFQTFQGLFILIFALPMAGLWRLLGAKNIEPSTAMKMALGLFLLATGFVFMVLGGRVVDSCVAQAGVDQARTACHVASPWWLIFAYLFSVLGELCLSPVGLSYVTKVAPARFGSLLMGVWFLSNSAAQYIGGLMAGLTEKIPQQSTFWSIFLFTSLGAAVVLFALTPVLKRLTASAKGV
jgi:proton-dependent oligopeptide transporter, POT family